MRLSKVDWAFVLSGNTTVGSLVAPSTIFCVAEWELEAVNLTFASELEADCEVVTGGLSAEAPNVKMLLVASVVGFDAEAVSLRFAKGLVLASFGGTSPATSSGFVPKDPTGVSALLDNEKNGNKHEKAVSTPNSG